MSQVKLPKPKKLKIAIFHDYFGSIGGGEKLVLELAKGLNADIYTVITDKKNIKLMEGDTTKIINIGKVTKFPILKQIMTSWKFHKLNNQNYDFYIMSGNWAIFAAQNHKPNLLYCHTPVRMFYDSYEDFKKIAPWYAKPIFIAWVKFHKFFLEKKLKHVETIIANSDNCKKRIKKYHFRNSVVVNPPIKKYPFRKYGDFWLSVNRIYPHKRIELQIEAFRNLPQERLIIVGGVATGDHAALYKKKLLKNLPENVIFSGEISEKRLEQLYSECKAFITTSKDEDFGMSILEAMSAGKPAVAVKEGGYLETVTSDTGILIKPDLTDLIAAIKKISKDLSLNKNKYKDACMTQASNYSVKRFVAGVSNEIKRI